MADFRVVLAGWKRVKGNEPVLLGWSKELLSGGLRCLPGGVRPLFTHPFILVQHDNVSLEEVRGQKPGPAGQVKKRPEIPHRGEMARKVSMETGSENNQLLVNVHHQHLPRQNYGKDVNSG